MSHESLSIVRTDPFTSDPFTFMARLLSAHPDLLPLEAKSLLKRLAKPGPG